MTLITSDATGVSRVSVDATEVQLVLPARARRCGDGLCNPSGIGLNLLADPGLQRVLVGRGPAVSTQGLAREGRSSVHLNRGDRLIAEVRSLDRDSRERVVRSALVEHRRGEVDSAVGNVCVPEHGSANRAIKTLADVITLAGNSPIITIRLGQDVVRVLGIVNVDAADGGRSGIPGRHHSVIKRGISGCPRRCVVVDEPVIGLGSVRKLGPDANLLPPTEARVVAREILRAGGAGVDPPLEVAHAPDRIKVGLHVDREVTLSVRSGVVDRGVAVGEVSVAGALSPLHVDLHTLDGSGVLKTGVSRCVGFDETRRARHGVGSISLPRRLDRRPSRPYGRSSTGTVRSGGRYGAPPASPVAMIAVVPTTAIAFLTIREITNLSFLSIWIRIELVHCPIGAYISRIVNHLPNGQPVATKRLALRAPSPTKPYDSHAHEISAGLIPVY